MCGIWASIGCDGTEAALRLLSHRGPDGSGSRRYQIGAAAVDLGHRRLAIIDLDRRADQPMSDAEGRYGLVYNGEIYNYLELRAELQARGHVFRTQSDTEVLLAAWAQWGADMLPRLCGMFAFALLDLQRGELVVARDPFGIKPLFFAQTPSGLAFSSEIAPLLELPGVSRRGNAPRAYQYLLFGLTDGTQATLFADVHSFPAAHVARIPLDGSRPALAPQPYWRARPKPVRRPYAEAVESLRACFLDSVRMHLRSDVPLGAALSGGIDSSAIVAAMRAVGGAGLDLRTFSFVAPGHAVDESHWIQMAAGVAQARSHVVSASPEELVADLDGLIALQGEPFGSSSIYAQYRVMKLARENGIKVMLDGQGADELFAGYRPYLATRLAELLAKGKAIAALRFLRTAALLPGYGAKNVALQALGHLAPDWAVPLGRRLVGKPVAPDWLDTDWLATRGVQARGRGSSVGYRLHDRLLESLTATVLPALLRYEDRNSMHFSIESRVPFLTIPMVEQAYSYPSDLLIDDSGTTKAVFRSAMRGLVPDAILDRRDKIGFATPEQAWLQALAPWARAVLASPAARRLPLIRLDGVGARFDAMLSGNAPFDFQAWRWLNIIRWAEIFDVTFD